MGLKSNDKRGKQREKKRSPPRQGLTEAGIGVIQPQGMSQPPETGRDNGGFSPRASRESTAF